MPLSSAFRIRPPASDLSSCPQSPLAFLLPRSVCLQFAALADGQHTTGGSSDGQGTRSGTVQRRRAVPRSPDQHVHFRPQLLHELQGSRRDFVLRRRRVDRDPGQPGRLGLQLGFPAAEVPKAPGQESRQILARIFRTAFDRAVRVHATGPRTTGQCWCNRPASAEVPGT